MNEMTDSECAIECLKKDCLSCRRCEIGGRTLDNLLWEPDPENIANSGPISNVFSTMNPEADIMVVGQNPGSEEVVLGTPFVGASGKVFDEVVSQETGLKREDLYITNIVHCHTPDNRKPVKSEMVNCERFLDEEIKIVRPKVIVALGGIAFERLTGMRGIMKHVGDVVMSIRYMTPVVVVLHPSPYNTNSPDRREMFVSGVRTLGKVVEDL